MFLTAARAAEFFDMYHQSDFAAVPDADVPDARQLSDPMRAHIQAVSAYVDVEAIRAAKLRVAVDACNGVGALHTRRFLEHFGCNVVMCGEAVTGAFEREPEPLPENLKTLCRLVREHDCAVGFAQDPDGDRLALVDEGGTPLGEDLTVAFAVREVLEQHGRGPVVIHLSTSRSVRAVAEALGAPVFLSSIGEINVTERMLAVRAVVGGEGNGGVIVPAVHPCRAATRA